jgi:WD repeat and SOF domain-containing protein 1
LLARQDESKGNIVSEQDFTRERTEDVQKVYCNLVAALHPFEKAHKYTRALNAAKLDKVFAKPLIGALDGHADSVSFMAKNPQRLDCLLSGSMDGDIRLWDLAYR